MDIRKSKYNEYLKEMEYSRYTIKQYLWAFDKWGQYITSPETCRKYIIMVNQNAKSRGKARNPFYIGFLKSVIECFGIDYVVPKSRRKIKTQKKVYKFVGPETMLKIIQEATPKVSLLVRIYYQTGLRLRELFNVKRKDINLKDRTMSGIGKGGKEFTVKYSSTTTKLISTYLKHNPLEYPFRSAYKNVNPAYSFQYYLKKECNEMGIEGMHPHRIRHALGYYLRAYLGLDLPQIKVKLRHSNISSTEIYATATQEEVDKVIDQRFFKEEYTK